MEVYEKALEKYKLVKSFSRKEELKILLRMGECYEKLKIYGEALAVYQDALLLNPHE
jgi:tetratricopeptide (TPR) repeat protein